MIRIDTLIRTKRKTLSLLITPQGCLVVKAPLYMPLNAITAFIEKKQEWIIRSRQKILNNLEINKDLITYRDALFLGSVYPVMKSHDVKKVTLENSCFLLPLKTVEGEEGMALKKWYAKNAPEILLPRVAYFSNLMQLELGSLSFTNAGSRWGSCDSKSNIRLNWRLILLPHELIDYVIVHELAHIIELNHSKEFWSIVASLMPEYKQYVRKTKKAGFLLQLFR